MSPLEVVCVFVLIDDAAVEGVCNVVLVKIAEVELGELVVVLDDIIVSVLVGISLVEVKTVVLLTFVEEEIMLVVDEEGRSVVVAGDCVVGIGVVLTGVDVIDEAVLLAIVDLVGEKVVLVLTRVDRVDMEVPSEVETVVSGD